MGDLERERIKNYDLKRTNVFFEDYKQVTIMRLKNISASKSKESAISLIFVHYRKEEVSAMILA